MASVSRDKGGCKRLLFMDGEARRGLRLGKCSIKAATSFKVHMEALLAERRLGPLGEDTTRWLADLSDGVYAKLAGLGLVAPRQSTHAQAVTVAGFVAAYIKGRVDVTARTREIYGNTQANLAAHFGPDRLVSEVTPGDADQFRLYMAGKGYGDATVKRRLGIAKQFFQAAVRSRLIQSNPFSDQKTQVKGNSARFHFVTQDEYQAVMAVCPDTEWKVLFTLARIGGVRVPSETAGLRWTDINWEQGRVMVRSPKTARHGDGHGERLIPLWPELRTVLLLAFDEAPDGAEFVLRHRDSAANLRTHGERIVRRAGLAPWPKLWQNARASREIELCEAFPEHVVAAWIGHNQATARGFYLRVRPSDYERAAGWTAPPTVAAQKAAHEAQKAAQPAAANARQGEPATPTDESKNADWPGEANDGTTWQSGSSRSAGLEPATTGSVDRNSIQLSYERFLEGPFLPRPGLGVNHRAGSAQVFEQGGKVRDRVHGVLGRCGGVWWGLPMQSELAGHLDRSHAQLAGGDEVLERVVRHVHGPVGLNMQGLQDPDKAHGRGLPRAPAKLLCVEDALEELGDPQGPDLEPLGREIPVGQQGQAVRTPQGRQAVAAVLGKPDLGVMGPVDPDHAGDQGRVEGDAQLPECGIEGLGPVAGVELAQEGLGHLCCGDLDLSHGRQECRHGPESAAAVVDLVVEGVVQIEDDRGDHSPQGRGDEGISAPAPLLTPVSCVPACPHRSAMISSGP